MNFTSPVSLFVRPIFSSEMTSENAAGNASHWKIGRKRRKRKRKSQISDFFFERTCTRGHGGSCALRLLVFIKIFTHAQRNGF